MEKKNKLEEMFNSLSENLKTMTEEEITKMYHEITEYIKNNRKEAAKYFEKKNKEEKDMTKKKKEWEKNQRVHMKGDIIITDPCYVIKDELWSDFLEKAFWKDPSTSFKWLGFKEGIIADTLYGDWGCTLFKVKDIEAAKNAIKNETSYKDIENAGGFCADAGLVCVLYLDDCLNHNKEKVEDLLTKNWCAAVIKDFDGDVYIFDTKHEYEYEGEKYKDIDRHIVFDGGKDNLYISSQTSL